MKRGLIFIGLILVISSMVLIFAVGESCADNSDCVSPEVCYSGTCGRFALGDPPSPSIMCPDTIDFDSDTCTDADCPTGYSIYLCKQIGGVGTVGGTCIKDECEVILKLSSETNAHGEIYTGTDYNTKINYRDTFGEEYSGYPIRTCTGTNTVLRLSSETNAHAKAVKCEGNAASCGSFNTQGECVQQIGCIWTEGGWFTSDECEGSAKPCSTYYESEGCTNQAGCSWEDEDYPIDICYGDLTCVVRFGGCQELDNEKCVVRLSSETNAHLEKCENNIYPYAICCKSAGGAPPGDCERYITKSACLNNSAEACTWTPPYNATTGEEILEKDNGGGCCNEGEVWDSTMGVCGPTDVMCNNPWNEYNQVSGDCSYAQASYCEESGVYKYCAQIASGGGSIGYRYDVKPY